MSWVSEKISDRADRSSIERLYLIRWNGHESPANGPTREEVHEPYRSLLMQAQKHLGMTECFMGVCADDLANEGLYNYLGLLEEHGHEGAIRLARFGLGQDVMNLKTKSGNNRTKSIDQTKDSEGLDLDWESVEASRIYFSPEMVDLLSEKLTARELEVIILLFESDLTEKQTAERMRISQPAVSKHRSKALDKLGVIFSAPDRYRVVEAVTGC